MQRSNYQLFLCWIFLFIPSILKVEAATFIKSFGSYLDIKSFPFVFATPLDSTLSNFESSSANPYLTISYVHLLYVSSIILLVLLLGGGLYIIKYKKKNAYLKAQINNLKSINNTLKSKIEKEDHPLSEENNVVQVNFSSPNKNLEEKIKHTLDDRSISKQIERILQDNTDKVEIDTPVFDDELFKEKLQQIAPTRLTNLDFRYAKLITSNRNNLEIAEELGVEPKTVRMTKYRLKKKLRLSKEQDLKSFLQDLK